MLFHAEEFSDSFSSKIQSQGIPDLEPAHHHLLLGELLLLVAVVVQLVHSARLWIVAIEVAFSLVTLMSSIISYRSDRSRSASIFFSNTA